MTSSLVGSEMCIRDRDRSPLDLSSGSALLLLQLTLDESIGFGAKEGETCLLYTSDAADDM
eukprot:9394038-Prorocentrum_lima.AAC.1